MIFNLGLTMVFYQQVYCTYFTHIVRLQWDLSLS